MKIDVQWIGFLTNIGRNTIDRRLFLRLVGTQQTIPDNERSPKVFIDIFFLRAVMHPMIRRSRKNVFYPGW